MRLVLSLATLALVAAAATPAAAQRWGYPGHGLYDFDQRADMPVRDRSREGKVEVTRFLADDAAAQALGPGPVTVTTDKQSLADERERATYEAAVIDRLAGVGYDTTAKEAGQTVELTIRHVETEPAEAKRNPVHGSMSVGVDSRGGTYTGLAIGVDARKPLKALVATRLEARIRDAGGAVLWEGRADIATREGDARWTGQAIADKLATALFSGFPGKNGETIAAR
jgi:hypothetical protein